MSTRDSELFTFLASAFSCADFTSEGVARLDFCHLTAACGEQADSRGRLHSTAVFYVCANRCQSFGCPRSEQPVPFFSPGDAALGLVPRNLVKTGKERNHERRVTKGFSSFPESFDRNCGSVLVLS